MKRLIRTLVWLVFAASMLTVLVVTNARAEIPLPSVVGVHTFSWHTNPGSKAEGSRGWNNTNPGVYARWDNGLTVGTYRNSRYASSSYIGWTWDNDWWAVTFGVVNGYDRPSANGHEEYRCNSERCRWVKVKNVIAPMVVPTLRVPLDRVGLDKSSVRVALVKSPGAPAAVHLMLEHRFR